MSLPPPPPPTPLPPPLRPLRRLRKSSATSKLLSLPPPSGSSDIEDFASSSFRFTQDEALHIRRHLLDWYDAHQRQLPWRHQRCAHLCSTPPSSSSSSGDKEAIDHLVARGGPEEPGSEDEAPQLQQQRAYKTWVSEVMLQQTRVATVVQYFNRWMERWPTVKQLAAASEEEVNVMWAGLGYYRRARFLLEGAKEVVEERGGLLPSCVDELQKIPGIGKYTAGAIASIAFNQPVPVVDGNVIRVLCRLKAISASPKATTTVKTLWTLSSQLVDAQRPGDFNQALMELGATKCVRSAPDCCSCPLGGACKAFVMAKNATGAKNRVLVTDFPTKVEKNPPREEYVAVCVLERSGLSTPNLQRKKNSLLNGSVLLVKRPKEGLLAGLWEFPSVSLAGPETSLKMRRSAIDGYLKELPGIEIKQGCNVIQARENVGTYVHLFSHIRLHMSIEWIHVTGHGGSLETSGSAKDVIKSRWVSLNEIKEAGLTSGVRKVYEMFVEFRTGQVNSTQKGSNRKRKIIL